jgi:hypothetical protein
VVHAQLNVAGPVRATDLLIADSAGTEQNLPLAPTIVGDFAGNMLHGYLEIFADAPEILDATAVTFEIGATETSPALARAPIPLRTTADDPGCRIAGGAVNISSVPPGEHIARAVIAVRGRPVGRVTRPFRVAR